MRIRRIVPVTVMALVGLLTLAAPALAHPTFDENEAPARSLATVTLNLVHGCYAGGHAHGDDDLGEATTEVAVELPAAVTYLEPQAVDGWDVEVEDVDGQPTVVTWTDAGGAEPAPRLPMDLVVDADEGDEVWFKVVQVCDDLTQRWVGTPDEPADDPATSLQLTAPDPDRPAPEVSEDEVAAEVDGDTNGDQDAPAEPEETDDPEQADDLAADETEEAASDGAFGTIALVLLAVVAVAVVVALSLRRRRAGP